MACRLEEIPGVGDFVEYEILDQSVIVVRTSEYEVARPIRTPVATAASRVRKSDKEIEIEEEQVAISEETMTPAKALAFSTQQTRAGQAYDINIAQPGMILETAVVVFKATHSTTDSSCRCMDTAHRVVQWSRARSRVLFSNSLPVLPPSTRPLPTLVSRCNCLRLVTTRLL